MRVSSSQGGFILIFTLWVLGFLSVLAIAVGMGSRQKIAFLERLEDRSRQHLSAEAGAKKALALLVDDIENNKLAFNAEAKSRRHNNPADFSGIVVGDNGFDVLHTVYDETSGAMVERYGVSDEQGKLNLNNVSGEQLARLLADVLGMTTEEARKQSQAIIDWRDYGKHEAEGFFSDDYYKNLEHPYEMKEKPFERIDELLLVKGLDNNKYHKLLPFVTVWGDGRVNINTVSERVLVALGLDPAVAEKVLKVRRGTDDLESTSDDHIFTRAFDVAVEVKAVLPLEEREMRQIDALNTRGLLSANSFLYSIRSRSLLADGKTGGAEVNMVFDALANKIVFWFEK